ncbi:diguanylate cyclase/phosphodiesterase [Acidothermus cellulolyticus 11B]|jgi:diguanylate cyclase (GGDEF)-like protein|uniref:Diguanylate cyclase/phosphodiesterase n=1 Tax=Acidothermus cellulolyticus (strain ATCC 43068 / DSM 8971 / 11B) TaxID=351607 RepID=A0LT36_ACIC1|nr:diguanylate cyclase/phosphodiesterase [Acidothermus cellulolyticus 11B]
MCFAGFLRRRSRREPGAQTRDADENERWHTISRWSDRNYRDASRALVPAQRRPVEDSSTPVTSAAANASSDDTDGADGADCTDHAGLPATPVSQLQGGGTTATHRRASEHAGRDDLTGVANRPALLAALDDTFEDIHRRAAYAGLLVVNIRGFKQINAIVGHSAADQLLTNIAMRLASRVRHRDVVARLGADEFAVLLRDFNRPEGADAMSRAILRALREPFDVAGLPLTLDVAAGLAVAPRDADTSAELLRRAMVALQAARHARSPAVENYRPAHDPAGAERLTLHAELDAALRTGQLVLHYQSTVDLATGRTVGVEALLRWQHPRRGLLRPAEFLPAAEQSELIGLVTSYVLDAALASAVHWRQKGIALPVSVNISARDLHDPSFPDRVDTLLHLHGVPADRLTLEITETTLNSRLYPADAVAKKLRDLGVRLSCDDFGTGTTPLPRLRDLPLAELKIDNTLIAGIVGDDDKRAIVAAVVELGRVFDLTVVAEGIERQDEREVLIRLGCTTGQGYYFSPPVPGALIGDVLRPDGERATSSDTRSG